MYGEVYVPYTGIGGTNMDSGVMPADISGSSGIYSPDGETLLTLSISWELPGGITSLKYNDQGVFGYLFQGDLESGHICYDNDVIAHLEAEGIENPTENPATISILNEWVLSYANRVQKNDGLQPGYDWTEFNRVFGSCIRYPDI